MNQSKEKLRRDFYAEADTTGGSIPGDWQKYAEWLEDLVIKDLNKRLIIKNERLEEIMQKAIDILEEGIIGG